MEIPAHIKIGAVTYKVRLLPDWPGRDEADGESFYERPHGHAILIYDGLTAEAQEITLLHEILHCLNATINHEFLDSLAEQLHQVLSENHMLR